MPLWPSPRCQIECLDSQVSMATDASFPVAPKWMRMSFPCPKDRLKNTVIFFIWYCSQLPLGTPEDGWDVSGRGGGDARSMRTFLLSVCLASGSHAGSAKTQVALPKAPGPVPTALRMPAGSLSSLCSGLPHTWLSPWSLSRSNSL